VPGLGAASADVLSLKALAAAERYKAACNNPEEDPEDFKDEDLFEIVKIEKLFTEYCRSDVDLNQINYALQSFVDAVHSRPAPIRASKCSGALSLLSDCFAMTELLAKLPPHVDTLVICCPSYLNIVPWHLLHIEEFQPTVGGVDAFGRDRMRSFDVGAGTGLKGNGEEEEEEADPPAKTLHMMDKYVVRLGGTIPMMEVSSNQSSRLPHEPGVHKLCFVDADHDATMPLSETEHSCVRSLWSSDHWDYSLLHGSWACADRLATKLTTKRDFVSSGRPGTSNGRPGTSNGRPGTSNGRPGTSNGRPGTSNGRLREHGVGHEASEVEEEEEEEEGQHRTSTYLAGCRVLHLSALRQVEPLHPKEAAFLSANERAVKGAATAAAAAAAAADDDDDASRVGHLDCITTGMY
jgi:hypothetical protein